METDWNSHRARVGAFTQTYVRAFTDNGNVVPAHEAARDLHRDLKLLLIAADDLGATQLLKRRDESNQPEVIQELLLRALDYRTSLEAAILHLRREGDPQEKLADAMGQIQRAANIMLVDTIEIPHTDFEAITPPQNPLWSDVYVERELAPAIRQAENTLLTGNAIDKTRTLQRLRLTHEFVKTVNPAIAHLHSDTITRISSALTA